MVQDIQGGAVFSLKNGTKEIIAAIESDGDNRYFDCTLSCCPNPVCTCNSVDIGFAPWDHENRHHPGPAYLVVIDVMQKKLAFKNEKKIAKENKAFADLLLSSMNDADFHLLWRLYFIAKNNMTNQAPIDTIEAYFDFQKVEAEGLMYAYTDILPYGDPLAVKMKGEDCLIADQYCLLPKCSCTDAHLTFVSTNEKLVEADRDLFTVAVNYRKKQWSAVEGHAIAVDLNAARSAVEDQIPDFYEQLPERHMKLKGIYAHCKKRHFKRPSLDIPKVGRNDPCPCGSGKKYKKCCM